MQRSHHFHGQMSDTFRAAVFVTLSGGFQDAYTYISRGQVFANAQTGNIVLLSAALLRGDWAVCLKYLIPILSFVLGTMAAEFIHIRFRNFRQLHWRQLVLLQEIVFLCAVGFLPHTLDPLANALVFRKVNGYAFASTMCIGNLRCAAEALGEYLRGHNRASLDAAKTYFGVILVFAAGAGLGSLVTEFTDIRAIWICCGLLLISFILMFIRDDREA